MWHKATSSTAALVTLAIALFGAVGGYAVNSYRVAEQGAQIHELEKSTVKREDLDWLKRELDSMNQRLTDTQSMVKTTDSHILEHMKNDQVVIVRKYRQN